jgi:hypothetical protein
VGIYHNSLDNLREKNSEESAKVKQKISLSRKFHNSGIILSNSEVNLLAMMQWLLADLHIHSTFSDGSVQIKEIVRIYGEAGFDVIAITDHLFDTQSPISIRLREEGKSVKDV